MAAEQRKLLEQLMGGMSAAPRSRSEAPLYPNVLAEQN